MTKTHHTPRVSILIATHNGAKYISRAIESILTQSYPQKEIIIIDDASQDTTYEIIEAYARRYPSIIHVFRNAINQGITKTSNLMLEQANGTYVGRLDDDDYVIDPKKIEKQVKFFENHPDHVLVGTFCKLFFEDGRYALKKTVCDDEILKRNIYRGTNPFTNSTVLFRTQAARDSGAFDTRLSTTQDLELFLKLGKRGKFAVLPIVTTVYTVRTQALSVKKRKRQALDMIAVLQKHHKAYANFYHFWYITFAKIIAKQIIASLLPRSSVMKWKYRKNFLGNSTKT